MARMLAAEPEVLLLGEIRLPALDSYLKWKMEQTDAGTFTKSTDTGTVCISQPG